MQQEIIQAKEKEITIRVQNSRWTMLRRRQIEKKAIRVFDRGCIGISGGIGATDEAKLAVQARENLQAQIPYPYPLSHSDKDRRDHGRLLFDDAWMQKTAEAILDFFQREQPDLSFSESISLIRKEMSMKNTAGLDLSFADTRFQLELILKEKDSSHLFDGLALYDGRSPDLQRFFEFNQSYLSAYHRKVKLPEGDKMPVFMLEMPELGMFLSRALSGENYATGSSLFSGKMKGKLFCDSVDVELCRDGRRSDQPFFDMEGCRLENDRIPLIENGRLERVYTDKRSAAEYDLPHVAAATGDFDDVPSLGRAPVHLAKDSQNLPERLDGRLAILVIVSAGGDFTSDGHYAAPVQVSFLFDGEKILGKLPEFGLRSHLDAMLGQDYLGTFAPDMFYFGNSRLLHGFDMTIIR